MVTLSYSLRKCMEILKNIRKYGFLTKSPCIKDVGSPTWDVGYLGVGLKVTLKFTLGT